jgi:hypothetical protein
MERVNVMSDQLKRIESPPASTGSLSREQADHLLDLAQAAARDEARDPADQGRAWEAFVTAAYGLTARRAGRP